MERPSSPGTDRVHTLSISARGIDSCGATRQWCWPLHAVPARLEASDYTVPQDDLLEVLWGAVIGTRLLTSRACASDGLTRLAFGFTREFAQRAANIARTTFLTSIQSTPSGHSLGFC